MLTDAEVTVTITNNEITEVTQLTVTKAGTLNAKDATIAALVVDADQVKLENLTVSGAVTLTNNVTDAFNVKNVTMESFVTPQTQELVASTRSIAAVATRLKITFTDSTVAYVEIRQDKVYFSSVGNTKVTSISVKADEAVIASSTAVLPSLKIEKGVTKVELNASIANIEIESTTDIEVTGKGNFDNVSVKTDKAVALLTEGTIGALNTESKNIELGTNLKVDSTLLNGEKVDAAEIIVNIDQVEQNVNRPIEENDKEAYFVAKPVKVEGKFGMYTLNFVNASDATIKYEIVSNPRNNAMATVGQQAPTTAKVYQPGDEYVAYFKNEVYVYKTDANNVILESFKLDRSQHQPGYTTVAQSGNKLELKMIYEEKQTLYYFLIATESDFFVTEQSDFSVDKAGIPTFTLTLPDGFEITEDSAVVYEAHGITGSKMTFTSGSSYGNRENHEKAIVNYLTSFVKFDAESFVGHKYSKAYHQQFAHSLHHIFYDKSIIDVYSDTFYKTTINEIINAFKTTNYTSFNEVQEATKQIIESQAAIIAQLKKVSAALDALYLPDADNWPENIRPDLTEHDFSNVQQLIDQLAGNADQKDLQNQLNAAKYNFEQYYTQVDAVTEQAAQNAHTLHYSFAEGEVEASATVDWK